MTSGYTQCPCCGYDTVSSDMAEPEFCSDCEEYGCDEYMDACQQHDEESEVQE